MAEHDLHNFRGFRREHAETVVPEAASDEEATIDRCDVAVRAYFYLLTEIVAQVSLHSWIVVRRGLRQHRIHGERKILRLIVAVVSVARALDVRRVIAVPTVDGELMASCYGDNRRQRQLRVSVRRDVDDRRVEMELQGHAHIVGHGIKHHG